MNINPLFHWRNYQRLRRQNQATDEQLVALQSENKDLWQLNNSLSEKNAMLQSTVEAQNVEIARAGEAYRLLHTDWKKVVAVNAEYERQAHANQLHHPKKHGKHRKQKGKK